MYRAFIQYIITLYSITYKHCITVFEYNSVNNSARNTVFDLYLYRKIRFVSPSFPYVETAIVSTGIRTHVILSISSPHRVSGVCCCTLKIKNENYSQNPDNHKKYTCKGNGNVNNITIISVIRLSAENTQIDASESFCILKSNGVSIFEPLSRFVSQNEESKKLNRNRRC